MGRGTLTVQRHRADSKSWFLPLIHDIGSSFTPGFNHLPPEQVQLARINFELAGIPPGQFGLAAFAQFTLFQIG